LNKGYFMLSKQWVMIGSISAFFGVVFGAFGGHALKTRLSERALEIYQIGVHYHLVHALALVALGAWASQNPSIETEKVGWAFTLGIVLFSGSLYTLAITDLKFLGAVTPFGGISFLAGWLGFAYLAWRS
jgi:uncharacterized membrane protein YgdD (TMEM256/DUF423 family)